MDDDSDPSTPCVACSIGYVSDAGSTSCSACGVGQLYYNSTEGVGRVIEAFVRAAYPDIEVRHISSDHAARSAATIFRYDDNVQFVKEQVLPVVDSYRTEALHDLASDLMRNGESLLTRTRGSEAHTGSCAVCRPSTREAEGRDHEQRRSVQQV